MAIGPTNLFAFRTAPRMPRGERRRWLRWRVQENEPPVEIPPNEPKKPPVKEPGEPREPPPQPGRPPVEEPPNRPRKPPVKEPPPKEPGREPPQPVRLRRSA